MKILSELLEEYKLQKIENRKRINEVMSKMEFETYFDKLIYELCAASVYYSDTTEQKAFFAQFRKFLLNRKEEFNSGLYSFDTIYEILYKNKHFREYKYITEFLANINEVDEDIKGKLVYHYNRITGKHTGINKILKTWKPVSKQVTNDIVNMIKDMLGLHKPCQY